MRRRRQKRAVNKPQTKQVNVPETKPVNEVVNEAELKPVNAPETLPVNAPETLPANEPETKRKSKHKSRNKSNKSAQNPESMMFGKELSFAAKEAYKLLRTNLMFSLPEIAQVEGEAKRAHIVGITSAVRGEGKSTTTLNLASTLAEQGERVLVIEGDMRLPSLHKKLKSLKPKPGLSNVLITSGMDPEPFIQTVEVTQINEVPITFDVLVSGEIPPNPSELIGSNRMKRRLEQLAKKYQFILLDLPPVNAVTDALVATKLVDGVVMVVRSDYADSNSLREAVRQLQLVDGKILGFVFTCANSSMGGYKRKYKYRYYKYGRYRGYGYRYGYGYGYGYGHEEYHK